MFMYITKFCAHIFLLCERAIKNDLSESHDVFIHVVLSPIYTHNPIFHYNQVQQEMSRVPSLIRGLSAQVRMATDSYWGVHLIATGAFIRFFGIN